jgi:nitroimidazol reductase NimA-like FMN-containing flavoprotein (pyridoxamine 5'-phosphate oxidase superfamily)
MIGLLAPDEIESMLRRHTVGRLACSANDRPYVVPLAYAYDGACLYGFATVGRKVEVMREQPLVCFELDEIEGPSIWRSVVAEGVYEELTDERQRRAALALLDGRGPGLVPPGLDAAGPVVLFRIRLTDRSGRFERRDA